LAFADFLAEDLLRVLALAAVFFFADAFLEVFAAFFDDGGLLKAMGVRLLWLSGGVTIPAETTIFTASSTPMSKGIASLRGQNSKNPEVGFGVVGTKTLIKFSDDIFWTSPWVDPVTKPIDHNPGRGY